MPPNDYSEQRRRWCAKTSLMSALLAVILVSGCRSLFDPCQGTAQPGLLLTLSDGQTGEAPTALVTVAVEGIGASGATYVDTFRLEPLPGPPLQLPIIDLPGTYTVTITAAGYGSATIEDIRLDWDSRCDTMKTTRRSISLHELP